MTIKTFVKLNIFSALCGFIFFLAVVFQLNIYRIERVSNMNFDSLGKVYSISYSIGLILSTATLIFLVRKWMAGKLVRFWSLILWFPYFLLFNYIFISLFPITYPGDRPSPSTGLLIILGMILYPFCLGVINLVAVE